MSLIKLSIQCDNCNNEYIITYNDYEITTKPIICTFCGDSVNIEEKDEDETECDDSYEYSK